MLPVASIILAGGKGTRMHSADRHKVCFEVDGKPAINRAIETYKACGVHHHVVVVGAMAGQVIETVGKAHEGVVFAYQAEQRGTGHAARQGARFLSDMHFDGAVLVVAGDRLLDPRVVEGLLTELSESASDLVFLTGPRNRSEAGRVLRDDAGAVLAVVEHKDVLAKMTLSRIRKLALEGARDLDREARDAMIAAFPTPEKAALAFGALWARMVDGRPLSPSEMLDLVPPETCVFQMGNRLDAPLVMSPEETELSDEANRSVYLVRAQALYYALSQLTTNNAQGEEYLSDIVNILAQAPGGSGSRYRVRSLFVSDPDLVMGFNNPAELLEVENRLRSRKALRSRGEAASRTALKTVADWRRLLDNPELPMPGAVESSLASELLYIYGSLPELIEERKAAYSELLRVCEGVLGSDRPILLARAPGRINMMGRHIDHQGGYCNLMSIDREVLVAAAPREDDEVHLYNVRPEEFGERAFSMADLLAELTWDDWLSLVNSDKVLQMVRQSAGDWAQYVRAAFLRLQKHYPDIRLHGLDMVFHGTVPVAAGLSSSSAIVVATAEAIVASNGLDVRPQQFVDLCGEGEWFVGTRGGAGDHAAMKFAQRDAVINVGFLPFVVGEATPFPNGYRLVFCNSKIKAQKASSARELFNQRVACYHLGVHIIRKLYPQFAPLITHLRDISTRQLPVRLADIYRMLLKLPERVRREDLSAWLEGETLQQIIGHDTGSDAVYPVRGVVLFGLAECERAILCPQLLRTGDMQALGRLMCISHDGDRVARHDAQWRAHPYQGLADNAYLLDLMADIESGVPERVTAAQLAFQPGSYGCSIPELDLMVDIALRCEGVVGAQLAGAGLGGGIMVLVREEAIPQLTQELEVRYYLPRGLVAEVLASVPIAGSGVLMPGPTPA
jgi:N-acetylgalactosamine kinase